MDATWLQNLPDPVRDPDIDLEPRRKPKKRYLSQIQSGTDDDIKSPPSKRLRTAHKTYGVTSLLDTEALVYKWLIIDTVSINVLLEIAAELGVIETNLSDSSADIDAANLQMRLRCKEILTEILTTRRDINGTVLASHKSESDSDELTIFLLIRDIIYPKLENESIDNEYSKRINDIIEIFNTVTNQWVAFEIMDTHNNWAILRPYNSRIKEMKIHINDHKNLIRNLGELKFFASASHSTATNAHASAALNAAASVAVNKGMIGKSKSDDTSPMQSMANIGKNGKSECTATDTNSNDDENDFICPISMELMTNPVLLIADGHTYEAEAIEEWFESLRSSNQAYTSPITGNPVSSTQTAPNYLVKNHVDRLRRRRKSET